MTSEQMIADLQHEQRQLLFWMGHAQKQGLGMYAPRMAWALTIAATLQRTLRTQAVTMLEFLEACNECSAVVNAYFDELHEREYQDRIWTAYLKTREWVNGLRRKGLVEKDMDGNYDLTDAGRDYFNVDNAA
jgi:hypothetical protein